MQPSKTTFSQAIGFQKSSCLEKHLVSIKRKSTLEGTFSGRRLTCRRPLCAINNIPNYCTSCCCSAGKGGIFCEVFREKPLRRGMNRFQEVEKFHNLVTGKCSRNFYLSFFSFFFFSLQSMKTCFSLIPQTMWQHSSEHMMGNSATTVAGNRFVLAPQATGSGCGPAKPPWT